MSELVQSRQFDRAPLTSGPPDQRTILGSIEMSQTCRHNRTYASQQESLFDHLVGADEQRLRQNHSNLLRSFRIDR